MADSHDLKAFCQQLQEEPVKRYKAGDFKGLSELYTPNCKLMPTGTDVLFGREAVEKSFRDFFNAGAKWSTLDTDEAGQVHGDDCLYERGHYKFFNEDGSVREAGKYVIIWKKIEGEYRIDIDIWNANQ
ncbi:uncharacterized protein LOC100371061 [Saccoglossus kowalevskii]|uniref:Uncharacterized protein LOC100371061 n=1 Tax=Saccoglossus kowalevskii TaxID=10224 RepID=A0ABM0GQY5_SACKO|nr:PREDICTED: uncharacterized protein LOC100371061 [Saccoglossus kowalevskii]